MSTSTEETPNSPQNRPLPPARRGRRSLPTGRGADSRERHFEVRRALMAACASQPRAAARAGRLASKHASLRHRARGDVGRIIGLINEAARLTEVRDER